VLAAALLVILVVLMFANPIAHRIGRGGANVLKRIMGLVLAAVAVNMVLSALTDWLGLPKL
jgi:multiple antibiotic resistance protein